MILFSPLNSQASAIEWANGTWELKPGNLVDSELAKSFKCSEYPLTVKIDSQSERYESRLPHAGKSLATITRKGDEFIVIEYDGEERVMDNGELHVWIMFFNNPDEFVWIREDWIVDGIIKGTTTPRIRCKAGIS